jgi:hypothetical protein
MSSPRGAGYGRLDRLLHTLAFRGTGVQKAVADLEDQMFRKELAGVEIHRPVFITSLPRAGTTLLLDLLHAVPGFATHTYRNMPFVLCPMLWERVAGSFRKTAERRERAHGDGMLVGFDSPEAFEEVVWQAFWPKKYRDDRILPWTAADRDPEFEDFLRSHIAKIVRLGAGDGGGRYVSKNNANIGRVDLVPELFPDATIVVPFRAPLQQASSLLRQHRRFVDIHRDDEFARAYMAGIGHHEFGANLRPLDFDDWLAGDPADSITLDFWLAYWAAAFAHVLARRDRIVLVDYDRLCREPAPLLGPLAERLGIPPDLLLAQTGRFRPPTAHDAMSDAIDPDLRDRAGSLHAKLQAAVLD